MQESRRNWKQRKVYQKQRSVRGNGALRLRRKVSIPSTFTGKKTSTTSSFLGRKSEAKRRKRELRPWSCLCSLYLWTHICHMHGIKSLVYLHSWVPVLYSITRVYSFPLFTFPTLRTSISQIFVKFLFLRFDISFICYSFTVLHSYGFFTSKPNGP